MKIEEVKAMEREDAVFECVLSHPTSTISWFGKNVPLEKGEKYDVEVSEDKLIHRLVVKDCMVVDKGIYSACAGIKSCSSWLIVEGKVVFSLNVITVCDNGWKKRNIVSDFSHHVHALTSTENPKPFFAIQLIKVHKQEKSQQERQQEREVLEWICRKLLKSSK